MENLIIQIENALVVVGAIVTAATLIVAGLDKIAQITPTKRDDEYVGKIRSLLVMVSAVLDKVSVYTTSDKKK
jgi:hypothetical protein